MTRYKRFILTVECNKPFCPAPAPYEGYTHVNDACRDAKKIVDGMRKRGGFEGKAISVWDTENSVYAKIYEI